jgi:Flp pilus assembly pilin Flp
VQNGKRLKTDRGGLEASGHKTRLLSGGGEKQMLEMIMAYVNSVREREEGQALVEYALILSIVSIGAIALLGLVSGGINDTLQTVVDAL